MNPRRTKYYLDKQNAKWKGVCAGIADYTGVDVTLVRVATVVLTLLSFGGGLPWGLVAYVLTAWIADNKPIGLYQSDEDRRFWQGVRQSPQRSTREVSSRFRELDRRLADMEAHVTSRNTRLADEIDSLR
ncbi:phage shock protein C [Sphingomonas jejuensis]|jgi:phage shock protein C|uniref:Phage shock protein C n=1 Tax=Sphingomonas jejuensis TaxID=904715 RepID=A0ABX0XLE7_9SPHN|nr:envelope stress response membrane protein PspC [Sphingomonas jejuensis]NJC33654.1 phage shock protein C [Sphingomonas jejuensis]